MWHFILFTIVLMVIFLVGFGSSLLSFRRKFTLTIYMLLGWAIPGLGHLLLGKRTKAIFYFFTLVLASLFGLWLCGFRPPSLEDNPFYFIGNFGCLLNYIVCQALSFQKSIPRPDLPASFYEPAMAYICIPALLNLLIVFNLYNIVISQVQRKDR